MAEQEPHAEQGSVQHTSNVDTTFDELAKGLTNGTLSRRKALRMFGAALVGGMLASIPGVALADHNPNHGGGRGRAGCPSGITCKGQCCPVGASCVGRGRNQVCACPTGQTDCGGVCRDLATDELNCGLCGNACAQGASCVSGTCVSAVGGTCASNDQCASGLTCQNGTCVAGIGGACTSDNQCVTGTTCQNGTCLVSVGGTCTSNDQCASGTCESGQCVCPTGTTLCPGNNTCVQSCPSGQTLNATTCQCENTVCPEGTVLCGTQCVSTNCNSGQAFDPNTCTCVDDPLGCCTCCVTSTVGGRSLIVCSVGPATQSECNSRTCDHSKTFSTDELCGTTCCTGSQSCVNGVCV